MLTKDEVQKIAALARIGLSDKETEKYQKDLSAVLDYFEKLQSLDTGKVEPIGHIAGRENSLRVDGVSDFKDKEGIVKLFPEEKDGFDKVKSVL